MDENYQKYTELLQKKDLYQTLKTGFEESAKGISSLTSPDSELEELYNKYEPVYKLGTEIEDVYQAGEIDWDSLPE